MVIERIQYFCEICNVSYNSIAEAEQCELLCSRLAESLGIEELNLSRRTYNALYYANINTINDLSKLSKQGLLKIKGIGDWSFNELKLRLEEHGVTLTKGDPKQPKKKFSIRKYMSERQSKEEQNISGDRES